MWFSFCMFLSVIIMLLKLKCLQSRLGAFYQVSVVSSGSSIQKLRSIAAIVWQVCLKLSRNEGTRVWNSEMKVPYLVDGDQWIGYDDEESITEKVILAREASSPDNLY